jgi:hypothetical protein
MAEWTFHLHKLLSGVAFTHLRCRCHFMAPKDQGGLHARLESIHATKETKERREVIGELASVG